MKILVACEYSGRVRDAFIRNGHDAYSCDLLDTEGYWKNYKRHYQCNVEEVLYGKNWDMLIAFPPCTHLCVSGARHFENKIALQIEAVKFFKMLATTNISYVAIENPIGIMSKMYRKPDQVIQPWWFGHGETKSTCLWLTNLPLLKPTNVVSGREARIHRMPPGPDRAKERSRTYQGIANAMATQWGKL